MEEEVITQEPAQEKPKLRKIYDYLKSKDRIKSPTYEDFEGKMRNPKKLQGVYDYLKSEKKIKAETFEDFQQKITPPALAPEAQPTQPAQGTGLVPEVPIEAPARQPVQPEGPDISMEAQTQRLANAIRKDAERLAPEQEPIRMGDRMTDAPTQRPDKQGARDYVTDVYNQQNDVNERNPIVTNAKMLWSTISNDLPAALYGSLAVGMRDLREPGEHFITKEGQQLATENKQLAHEGRKQAVKAGLLEQQEAAKDTDGLVKSLSQVKDPLDAINYIFGALGQGLAQIPLSVGSAGMSSAMQSVGPIYLGGVKRIAEEKGLTIDQVMDQNLDEPIFAATYGTIAGLLDRFGAGKVLGSFSKEAVKKSLQNRAQEIAITGGIVEPFTEYAQTGLEQLGEEQVAGKGFTESVKSVMSDPEKSKERIEALVQGFIVGAGLSAVGGAIPNKNDNQTQPSQPPSDGDIGSTPDVPGDGNPVVSATSTAPTVQQTPAIQQPVVNPEQPTAPAITTTPVQETTAVIDQINSDNSLVDNLPIEKLKEISDELTANEQFYKDRYDDVQHIYNIVSDKIGDTQNASGAVSDIPKVKADEKGRKNKGRKERVLAPSPEEEAVAQAAAAPITPEPVQQDDTLPELQPNEEGLGGIPEGPGLPQAPEGADGETGAVLPGDSKQDIQQPSREGNPPGDSGVERPTPDGEIKEGTEVTFDFTGRERTGKVIGYKSEGRVKIKGSDGIVYTKDVKDISTVSSIVKKAKPKDAEKTVAYNSKRKKPIGIISNGLPGTDSFMFQTDLGKKISDFFKKQFTAKGFLPQGVFNRWLKTRAEIAKYEAQVRFSLGDIKKSIKDEYGGKPTDEQITDLNLALQGKVPQNPIPPKTAALLETMRAQIDDLSRRFIDEGIVSGDLKATFTKNLGTYLTRSYRKFDDPFWADFVPPEIRNKAESFIRDQYQYNAQRVYAKATRALDADKKKAVTIQKLRERISRIKDTFTGDKAGQLSAPKARQLMQERDEAIAKVNERISRLEDQVTRYPEIADYLEAEAFDLLDNGLYYEFLDATDNTELRAQELLSRATKKRDAAAKAPEIIAKLQEKVRDIKAEFTGDRSGKLTPAQARKLIAEKDQEVKALEERIKKIEDRDYQQEAQELSEKAQEMYNISSEDIEGLINYLLYNPEAPTALLKGAKLGSKDLSILKKRGDIAPEIRALLGEYGDPLLNYARTITKMANLVAKHHFLVDIKAQGMNVFLFEKPVGKYSAPIAAEGSKTMAPLNGLYTTPEIAEAFDEFNSMEPVPNWMKYYMQVNYLVKSGKTVFSAMTHARNFFGNLGFVVANGHWRAGKFGKAVQTAWANIYSKEGDTREKLKEYIELGVIQDGGVSGELRKMVEDIKDNKDFFERMNDSRLKKAKNAVLNVTQDLYQFEDDLYKIFAFENEYARYRKALPGLTDQEVKEKAAKIVRDTYPTYSLVPKIVKQLRAFPLVGTFVSFPAEVLRTAYNTVALAKEEMSNKSTFKIGATRAAGLMASVILPTAASYASRAFLGLDDQDDEDLRRFVAPWQRNSEFLYLGVDGNKYRLIDMGYSDPHSYLKRPVYDLLSGNDLEESAIESVKTLAEPFATEEILAQRIIDIMRNQKQTGDHVYNPDTPVGDRTYDIAHHVQTALEPGTVSSMRRIIKAAGGKTDKYGNKFELQNEVIGILSGQKQEVKDIDQALLFRAFEIKDRVNLTEKEKLRVTRSQSSTDAEKASAQKRYDAAMKNISNDAYKIYMAAIRLGVDPNKAKKAMYVTKSPVIVKRIKGG